MDLPIPKEAAMVLVVIIDSILLWLAVLIIDGENEDNPDDQAGLDAAAIIIEAVVLAASIVAISLGHKTPILIAHTIVLALVVVLFVYATLAQRSEQKEP